MLDPSKVTPMGLETLRRYIAAGGRTFVLFGLYTPGVQLFLVTLEYDHFPPGQPENKLMEVILMEWKGHPFAIVCVPDAFRPSLDQVAGELKMRMGGSDIIAAAVGSGPAELFPLQGRNVLVLSPDHGNTLARMPAAEARQVERAAVEAFWTRKGVAK